MNMTMALVKYENNKSISSISSDSVVSNVLTLDNKELLLVSLLEKVCQLVDDKSMLFDNICRYLHKIGILEDPAAYSDKQQVVRKLYSDYLVQLMKQFKDNQKSSQQMITDIQQVPNNIVQFGEQSIGKFSNIQIINSQYSTNFIEVERLGEGGFGEVYKAINYIDLQKYAIKKVPFFDVSDPNNVRAFNEVRCLSKLSHENVVRYHSSWLELSDKKMEIMEECDTNVIIYPILYIQMELCMCNLRDYLRKRNYSGKYGNMSFEKACINGIINGLKYIHANGILHRDLNPNNIFLDCNMIPKIGDFGMAIKSDSSHTSDESSESEFGVELYSPPEYKKNNIYTDKSDVYSAGIIFFEILHIFSTDMERIKLIEGIKNNNYPSSFVENYYEYYTLIKDMLKDDMNERIATDELFIEDES